MPFYDFKCGSCGHRFDRMLAMAQRNDPQACPQCGGEASRVVIASFSSGSAGESAVQKQSAPCSGG